MATPPRSATSIGSIRGGPEALPAIGFAPKVGIGKFVSPQPMLLGTYNISSANSQEGLDIRPRIAIERSCDEFRFELLLGIFI